jgi:hypothetical protein
MPGPTVLDLPVIADELTATDILYMIRGVGVTRDKQISAGLIIPTILSYNVNQAINLALYKGDVVVFSTPAANITFTFANMLPNGRWLIVVNKATGYNITCAGTLVEVINPTATLYKVSDATSFYDLQGESVGKYDIVINTQAEFEYYFGTGDDVGIGATGTTKGGWICVDAANNETVTIPPNTSILLKSNPSDGVTGHFKYHVTNYPVKAYELNTKVAYSRGSIIHGEGIDQSIVARNSADNWPGFITTYLDQDAVTGVATNDFSVADSSNYQPGQTIEHSNNNQFYKVVSVPDATSVLVDRTITGAAAGNISICQDSIETKDWTFDGRCNVHGLGGARTAQAYNLSYCAHSNFEAKVINCKDANGGGYTGNNLVFKLKISNVFHCNGTTTGGACYQCSNSVIKNIYDCWSDANGGACYGCTYSDISEIHNCYCYSTTGSVEGGACHGCTYSKIYNIYNCYCKTTNAGSHAYGGAIYGGNFYDISNIHNCSCISTTGAAYGGACYGLGNFKIHNIYLCSCVSTTGFTEGGGCRSCDDGTIGDIHYCTVENDDNDALGGAAALCNKVVICGCFEGNTSDGAGTNTFSNMQNYCNNFIFDGAANQSAGAGPTNWD